MSAGAQHFQRLLGYEVARLRVRRVRGRGSEQTEPAGLPWPHGRASWRGAPA